MNFIASSGWLRTKGRNSRRSMTKISQLVFAVASAVRDCPSSTAISPKISPGPIRLKMALRPSGEEMLISAGPRRQRGVVGGAAEVVEGLRFKIAKTRMLAQHRQFVARKRPTPAVFVVEHPGHNHLNDLCLCIT